MARRSVKWFDYIRPSDKSLDELTPVFRFSEGRGSEYDYQTRQWKPTRPSDQELVQYLRNYIGDPNLGKVEASQYIGHDYIAMQWKDRKYFFRAMEAFLRRGIQVMTQSHLCLTLSPRDLPDGVELTPEVAEEMHLRDLTDETRHGIDPQMLIPVVCGAWPYTHTNSWLTESGRKIVQLVRKIKYSTDPESSDESAPVDRLENPKDESPEEKEEECLICMAAKPNTRVEPCGCVVACSDCSEQLQKTADRQTCVRCRRPITKITKI